MTSTEAKVLNINGWPRAGILEAIPAGKERSSPIRLISWQNKFFFFFMGNFLDLRKLVLAKNLIIDNLQFVKIDAREISKNPIRKI